MGYDKVIPHDERYAIAEEYMEVMYKWVMLYSVELIDRLWESSWADDALVRDAENNMMVDTTKVQHIEHAGKYFKLSSRFQTHPSPQRTPLLFQAGTSTAGKAFAARHAEAIYIGMLL